MAAGTAVDWIAVNGREPYAERMRVQTLLVLRSIMVFDAILLLLTGGLLAWFMEQPAGIIAGAACWLGSGMLFGGARYADRLYERKR